MMTTPIEIVIPTYKRVDRQITYRHLPKFLRARTTFVVREFEADEFKEKNPDTKVFVISDDTNGIAETRKKIAHHWAGKRIMVIEDDLSFRMLKYHADGTSYNATPDVGDWDDLIEDVGRLMDEGYVFGGLQAPGTMPKAYEDRYCENSRIMYANWFSEDFPLDEIEFMAEDHIEVFPEDCYVNLQLLTKGYKNMVLDYFRTNVTGGVNEAGGCSDYRTLQNHNDGTKWLAEQFPDFVSVRMKTTKNGPWKDLEKAAMTIQWKRAYASSQASSS